MDYYKLLGVSRTATPDEIKEAYRHLARIHHPDMNLDHQAEAATKFKEIAEAFEFLSDPVKRALYDGGALKTKPDPVPKPGKKKHTGQPFYDKATGKWYDSPLQAKEATVYPSVRPLSDYAAAVAPTHDIWGNKLSPEQQEEWLRNANSGLDLVAPKPKKPPMPGGPEFIDVLKNEYYGDGGPPIRLI